MHARSFEIALLRLISIFSSLLLFSCFSFFPLSIYILDKLFWSILLSLIERFYHLSSFLISVPQDLFILAWSYFILALLLCFFFYLVSMSFLTLFCTSTSFFFFTRFFHTSIIIIFKPLSNTKSISLSTYCQDAHDFGWMFYKFCRRPNIEVNLIFPETSVSHFLDSHDELHESNR